MKRVLLSVFFLLVAAAVVLRLVVPRAVENQLNGVYPAFAYPEAAPPAPVSAAARQLHDRLFIADLHADSLLWGRDLTEDSTVGHIDLPRLKRGNIALQTFAITTKTPRHLNIERNSDDTDNVFWLALFGGWPFETLTSLKARTLFLAGRLGAYTGAAAGQDAIWPIRYRQDLEAFLVARTRRPDLVAGMLSIEGLHALEGDIGTLASLDAAGIRVIGLAHFFDNEVAGSAHGLVKGGLTPLGREVVRALESRHILVDLAHSSAKTIDEALALATRPVVVSHTGVKGTCDNARNLSDAQLRAVAATGGVIGIGYWEAAVCGKDTAAIARAVVYAVGVVGADHVALGSDFDGSTFAPFDAAGLPQLTQSLLDHGLGAAQIAAVMGENVKRLLLAELPVRP